MKLSIIIPVYNEEKTLQSVIKSLQLIKIVEVTKEIIIVNDGSTDKTSEILKNFPVTKDLRIYSLPKNQGKGAAVREGITHATGEYVLIQDADLEYNPSDIQKLVQAANDRKKCVIYGSRLKRMPNFNRDERTFRFFLHYSGNKFLSLLTSALYGQWVTDMETGYKLVPIDVIRKMNLRARGFELEPEITAKILKKRIKIYEVPITTNPRGYKDGKKLNTGRDGMIALWSLLKYRFID